MPMQLRFCFLIIAAVVLVSCTSETSPENPVTDANAIVSQQPSGGQVGQTNSTESQGELAESEPEEPDYCMECHSDKQRLIDTGGPALTTITENHWGSLQPMEPWEKVFVDKELIDETVHGHIPCSDCHGGQQSPIKTEAHDSLIKRPSQGNPNVCSSCHPNVAEIYPNSLHASLKGFKTALYARSTPENHPVMDEIFTQNCAGCHTSCGDCHVSRPESVGGGLFAGHQFLRTPPMVESCAACHAATVGAEYMGLNESYPADVHLVNGNMTCTDCHSGAQMHGQPANCSECHTSPPGAEIPPPNHRYAGIQSPSCLSCHADITIAESEIPIHQVHGAQLSCQVCHSIAYTNCEGCHLAASGYPDYELEESYLSFVLGLNPQRTFTRPYKYVPLRHIPVTPNMYDAYGEGLLSNFDASPTWTYTTPHNIQRYTFQAAGCQYCHGNDSLFLTADKVHPDELEANRSVIVPQVPAPIGGPNSGAEEPMAENSP